VRNGEKEAGREEGAREGVSERKSRRKRKKEGKGREEGGGTGEVAEKGAREENARSSQSSYTTSSFQ
jgi:hypothetical protein